MTAPKIIAGRPITGDTSNTHKLANQRPIEELVEHLDAVLNLPGVDSVKWAQYTPGWNDGDACIFSANEPRVRVAGIPEDDGDYGDGYLEPSGSWPEGYFDTHARRENVWNSVTRKYEYAPLPDGMLPADYDDMGIYVNGERRKDIEEALRGFGRALGSGSYDHAMIEYFGDPSEIVATLEGFEVESYDCGY